MNTQRLRTVTPLPPEPNAGEAPAAAAPPVVPARVVPVGAPAPLPLDPSLQQTSVMHFEDLEEFRQAARAAFNLDAEEDRVTPTGLLVSPFARIADAPASKELVAEVPLVPSISGRPAPSPLVAPPAVSPRESALARSFREASWPKRATALLLPLVIGLYGLKAFRHRAAASQPARHVAGAPSASGAVASSAVRADPGSNVDPPVAQGSLPSSPGDGHGPSLQRRAVDAYATGDFAEAAALYRRLATEHPDRSEFAIAAQIAVEKVKGGQHE